MSEVTGCSEYVSVPKAVLDALRAEVAALRKGERCHAALFETTYECDINKPCPACRLRRAEEQVAALKADKQDGAVVVAAENVRLRKERDALKAMYEGDLTKEEIRSVSMLLTSVESVAEHDAAIRQVRRERGKA